MGGGKRGSLDGRAQRGGGVARGRRTRAEGPARQRIGAARSPRVGSACAGVQDEAGSGEVVQINPPEPACGAHAAPQRGRVGTGDCGPLSCPGPHYAAAAQPRASRATAPHRVKSATVRPSRTRAGALHFEAKFARSPTLGSRTRVCFPCRVLQKDASLRRARRLLVSVKIANCTREMLADMMRCWLQVSIPPRCCFLQPASTHAT